MQYVHISPVKRSVNRIMTLETQLENIKSKGFLYYLYLSPETSFELIGLGYRLRCINASGMINKMLNGFSESNLPDKLIDSDHPFYFSEMIKGIEIDLWDIFHSRYVKLYVIVILQ